MKHRIFALALVAVLCLGLLAGCGKKSVVTTQEAQQIALDHAGLTASQVTDIHTHVVTADVPCYSIHIVHKDTSYSYLIDAVSGEILEANAD